MKIRKSLLVFIFITLIYLVNFTTLLYGYDYISSINKINNNYEVDINLYKKEKNQYYLRENNYKIKISKSEFTDKKNGDFIKSSCVRGKYYSIEYLKEKFNKSICYSVLLSILIIAIFMNYKNRKEVNK